MTGSINPADFIITRRRKKFRFALFHNAENCFELAEWQSFDRRPTNQIVVEVGAGTGLFSVELARLHPEKTFIAIDVKGDRLQKGARAALDTGLTNIFFVRARADQLLEVVAEGSVSELWLTFSDPFPKKRDAKRRLTAPSFLELYKKSHVSKNAKLYIKTDNHQLFDWSLEQLVAGSWHIAELTYDLHDSAVSDEYKIMTTYEQRWTSEGMPIYFVRATANRSGSDERHAA